MLKVGFRGIAPTIFLGLKLRSTGGLMFPKPSRFLKLASFFRTKQGVGREINCMGR